MRDAGGGGSGSWSAGPWGGDGGMFDEPMEGDEDADEDEGMEEEGGERGVVGHELPARFKEMRVDEAHEDPVHQTTTVVDVGGHGP